MSDKGVCITAPAILGLLKTGSHGPLCWPSYPISSPAIHCILLMLFCNNLDVYTCSFSPYRSSLCHNCITNYVWFVVDSSIWHPSQIVFACIFRKWLFMPKFIWARNCSKPGYYSNWTKGSFPHSFYIQGLEEGLTVSYILRKSEIINKMSTVLT